MKKIILATAFALTATGSALAQNFISVDVDKVTGLNGASDSTATYIRAGKALGDLQLNLQGRTATLDSGGVLNSLEVTTAHNKLSVMGIRPFVGVGHDYGFNGGRAFQYGLVGATAGAKVGPGFALVGAKTRVNWDDVNPKQTVGFATYMLPVAKNVSLNFNASKSWQDIEENAYGVGIGFSF